MALSQPLQATSNKIRHLFQQALGSNLKSGQSPEKCDSGLKIVDNLLGDDIVVIALWIKGTDAGPMLAPLHQDKQE
jgi:hypothetical protein